MELQTKVALPKESIALSHESEAVFIGSCFAEHIGQRMASSGLAVDVNPFGVLYNPESIALALTCILEGACPDHAFFKGKDGLWHSRLHSGDFSAATEVEVRENVNRRISQARAMLDGDLLSITWGTAHVYRLKSDNTTVGNCHKQPAAEFSCHRLSVDEITLMWRPLLEKLFKSNQNLQILLTVSPYRYAGYGLHENQLSKSVLHLAADALCTTFPGCHYFPAYEIVIDELRDYRFFEADMLHPSQVAVDWVWERFGDWCFNEKMREYVNDHQALIRDANHRPLHPESPEYAVFLKKAEERRAAFQKKWKSCNTPSTK